MKRENTKVLKKRPQLFSRIKRKGNKSSFRVEKNEIKKHEHFFVFFFFLFVKLTEKFKSGYTLVR